MEKQIIFGGAFNPPHVEHQAVLKNAKAKIGANKAVILPSYFPPHKNGAEMADFCARIKMCEMAFPNDYISDLESRIEEKSYTINTLRALKKENIDVEYYFAIGGDSMADFFKWYKPEEILKEVTLVVYPRESRESDCDTAIKKAKCLGGKIIKLDGIGQNISSGELRCLCALGQDISSFVGKDVFEYIKKQDLYKTELVDFAREKLTNKTFEHSLRTAVWALELNRKIGLSQRLVFESAIMHDIEKNSNSQIGVPKDAIYTPIAHQYSGAETAKLHGLEDAVVNAIKYHTTAKPDMSELEMLIYSADMTEPARNFESVEELREKLKENLKKGFIACLKRSYEYLLSQKKDIYHLTKDAYEYYLG